MKLTPNEVRVLQAIDASEYGDFLQDEVWTFSVTQECGVAAGSVAGVVSSLVKKGLLKASGEGTDATLRMTDSGAQTYVKIMDGITRKHAICTHESMRGSGVEDQCVECLEFFNRVEGGR